MNTNVEALKALYMKLGGNAADFTTNNIPDAIALVTTVASSGGGGGGAEYYYVTISVDTSGEDPVYSADKTIAEINAAKQAGKIIIALYEQDGMEVEVPCVVCTAELVEFSSVVTIERQTLLTIGGFHDENDKWMIMENVIPIPDNGDDGMFLCVDDGEYKLLDAPAPMIVNLSPVEGHDAEYTADVSAAVITAAINSGRPVYALIDNDSASKVMIPYLLGGDKPTFTFQMVNLLYTGVQSGTTVMLDYFTPAESKPEYDLRLRKTSKGWDASFGVDLDNLLGKINNENYINIVVFDASISALQSFYTVESADNKSTFVRVICKDTSGTTVTLDVDASENVTES